MQLLIDTHIIIWFVLDDKRLSFAQREALLEPANRLLLSPVVAYELTQLQITQRSPVDEPIDRLQALLGMTAIDLPSDCWRMIAGLPDIHRDPVDRLLIAHALVGGFTLVTADQNIRSYAVPTV